MKSDTTNQPLEPTMNSGQPRKSSLVKKTLYTLLIIVLCTGMGVGGYFLATQMNNSSTPSSTGIVAPEKLEGTPATHYVLAMGYPFSTDKVVTTRLGVPNELQAILDRSSIQDPGYSTILADKFNEEMGRWKIGRPTINADPVGDISLIHIAPNWVNQMTEESQFLGGDILRLEGNTPRQKTAFLNSLKNETMQCAQDNTKGFVVSELMNVCYSVSQVRQSVGSYSPYLTFRGYGSFEQNNFVFIGSISLVDDKKYTEDEATKLGDDFAAGNIPEQTKDLAARYITALKQTTIISKTK